MRLYKTKKGIVIQKENSTYVIKGQSWDDFVNDDSLFDKMLKITESLVPDPYGIELIQNELLPPIGSQELWASGVTYYRSKVGRQEESKKGGAKEFYGLVYEAERPELFFKATAYRTVGHKGKVNIRKDSNWDVPEPELTLVLTSSGKIVGYTIGNDMSSRSIEGENPLYLPQAKTYDSCAAIGPGILVTEDPMPSDTLIEMQILREGVIVFGGNVEISQMKRQLKELASFLYRECTFPHGSLLMTGTGIVPDNDFTLKQGDDIKITIAPIGTLVNTVR